MGKQKANQLQAIRGMNDILPEEASVWSAVESACRDVLAHRGYAQIRLPIVEHTQLFARSIGSETDIVAKEMYTFDDRNGDSLTLRPEGTASCVRAGIQHGMFYNQQQRLWYSGPMFRHERPQKGRYRQFHQLGAEAFGWSSPDIEAELIGLTAELFTALGLENTHLEINTLGSAQDRYAYRSALQDYLRPRFDQLDEDSQRRLASNPLRILDSKIPQTQELLGQAPSLSDFIGTDSQQHFVQLKEYLGALEIPFSVNPRLVRGLDYYNDTVFEWVNSGFGAQATVCAGGRYDGLVEQLGGAATPAFGFAMGLERLIQMLVEQGAPISQTLSVPDVYLVSMGELARGQALTIQSSLSRQGISVQMHCGGGSIKNQFKKADKSGARLAIIVGEEEAQSSMAGLKPLRSAAPIAEQQMIAQKELVNAVTNCLESL